MPRKQAKAKLPKTVAGVAVPKHLKKAIEPVLRFAGNPLVNDLLAGALVAGAEHLLGDKVKAKAGKTAVKAGKKNNPVGLLLAVAAGEIASHIVAAYQAPPKRSPAPPKRATKTTAKKPRATAAKRKTKSVPTT